MGAVLVGFRSGGIMAQDSEITGGGGVPEFLDSIQGNGFPRPVGRVVNWQVTSIDETKTQNQPKHLLRVNILSN